MPYGGRFLYKYYDKVPVADFDFISAFLGAQQDFLLRVADKETIKSLNQKNAYDRLKSYITSPLPSEETKKWLKTNIIDKMAKNRYEIIVISRGVAMTATL